MYTIINNDVITSLDPNAVIWLVKMLLFWWWRMYVFFREHIRGRRVCMRMSYFVEGICAMNTGNIIHYRPEQNSFKNRTSSCKNKSIYVYTADRRIGIYLWQEASTTRQTGFHFGRRKKANRHFENENGFYQVTRIFLFSLCYFSNHLFV